MARKSIIISIQSIDIVLPCFNPLKDWEKTIVNTDKSLQGISVHWIVVNDCTTRDISKEVDFLNSNLEQITYLRHKKNSGKGKAIRTGFLKCKNEVSLFTDIDIPFGVEGIKVVIDKVNEGNDVVFIKRNQSYFGHIPPVRQKLSNLAKWFNCKIFRLPFTDTQGGLKGFSTQGREILLSTRIDGYLFDIELAKKAHKNEKIKLTQVDVDMAHHFENVSTNYWRLLKEIPNIFYLILN